MPSASASTPARPIVLVSLQLAGVDPALFATGSAQLTATLGDLTVALAAACNVSAASVMVLRVLNASSALSSPAVLYLGALVPGAAHGGDGVRVRRRLGGSNVITVELQVTLADLGAAAALGAVLTADPSVLAARVIASLAGQGSPLAAEAHMTASVVSYPGSDAASPGRNTPSSSSSAAAAAGAAVGTLLVLAAALGLYCFARARSRRAAAAASEARRAKYTVATESAGQGTSTASAPLAPDDGASAGHGAGTGVTERRSSLSLRGDAEWRKSAAGERRVSSSSSFADS